MKYNNLRIVQPTECVFGDDFSLYYMLVVSKKSESLHKWNDFIRKCSSTMRKDFFNSLNNYNKKESEQKSDIDSFIKISKIIISDKENSRKRVSQIYQKIEKIKSATLKELLLLAVGVRFNNKGLVVHNIEKMAQKIPYDFVVEFQNLRFKDSKDEREYKDSILKIYQFIGKKINDRLLRKIFLNSFRINTSDEEVESLCKEMSCEFTSKELSTLATSYLHTRSIPGFIYRQLFEVNNSSLLDKLLETLFKKNIDNKLHFKDFWLLRYFLPGDELWREEISKELKRVSKGKDLSSHLLLLDLIVDHRIKKILEKSDEKWKSASFRLKRKFFRDLFKDGKISDFTIYNLILMGDEDPKILRSLLIE